MTDTQKAICRALLDQCYEHGFGASYPLTPIAEKLGLPMPLYDNDTNTGILWELGRHGSGLVEIDNDGLYATIDMGIRELVAHWSDWKG